MSWDGLNRRKFPRVIYPCLIKVTHAEAKEDLILTHTENIGVGGACVIIKKEVKLFTPVDIEIDLLDVDEHLRCRAKVVWSVRRKAVDPIKPLFYDIGVEFMGLGDQDQKRLQDTVARLVKGGAKILKALH